MFKDSTAARALLSHLATPDAATIWAKRGGFISPNKGVALTSYPSGPSQTMAQQVLKTTIYRPDLAGMLSPALGTRLTTLLQQYVASPARLGQVTAALEAAARTS
jgi:alpha-glucoside transport system substrate-binding protein